MKWPTLLCLLCATALAAETIKDEALVPPYTLPDPLRDADGSTVSTPEAWRAKRRPETLALFEQEVYGRTLVGRPPALKFVVREEKTVRGGTAVRKRVGILFEGREDGRQMEMLLVTPAGSKSPVFLGLNFDGNYTTTSEPDLPVPSHWAMGLYANKLKDNKPTEAGRGIHQHQWPYAYALEHGYGIATIGYGEIEPDVAGRGAEGPRGLGPSPGTNDWGSVGAWAWGLSRAMDYLETDSAVDARRVAVLGFSRLGKAALWASAQDERFALTVSLGAGENGPALRSRIFGETTTVMTERLGHWFAPRLKSYAGRDAEVPVDQHQLIALLAPRPVLVCSATTDLWSDPKGEFLGAKAAEPVYRLLGAGECAAAEWPEPSRLISSRIGYFLRPGAHDVTLEDWQAMIQFADRHLPPSP